MEIEELKKQKDNAYWERNQLVAALSKIYPAFLAKHPESDKDWEDDWRTIVFIMLPFEAVGDERPDDLLPDSRAWKYQLSWHIHDHDIPMFDHLKYQEVQWDGHTTEEKYKRLRLIRPQHPTDGRN